MKILFIFIFFVSINDFTVIIVIIINEIIIIFVVLSASLLLPLHPPVLKPNLHLHCFHT